jgi:O-methyltransferase
MSIGYSERLLRNIAKTIADTVIVPTVRWIGPLHRAIAYIDQQCRLPEHGNLPGHRRYTWLPGHDFAHNARYYAAQRAVFLGDLGEPRPDRSVRAEILARFERIDAEVEIGSSPMEALHLAEAALSLSCSGDFVECGCYAGGSTAKLSILASLTDRRLFAFDSFEGLPSARPNEVRDHNMRGSQPHDWQPGEYVGSLESVRRTVERYGEPSRVEYVKGWFSETLPGNLPPTISLAFADVDLASSAVDCLRYIWPRLAEGGIFFTHDVAYAKVLLNLHSEDLWRDVLREYPPIWWGAGWGLGDAAAHLGFAVKGNLMPEYLKALTLSKYK